MWFENNCKGLYEYYYDKKMGKKIYLFIKIIIVKIE